MAFAAPPLSTGRGRTGEGTGADPSASSGGGFRLPSFPALRSMRSTNDRPDADFRGSACRCSQIAAPAKATSPATIPGGPNDPPRA